MQNIYILLESEYHGSDLKCMQNAYFIVPKCIFLHSKVVRKNHCSGSGAFMTPDSGSGIGFFLISDPGHQTYIFESLMAFFG
jgi:hypothetical protein